MKQTLTCPKCQGETRIISFIDQPDAASYRNWGANVQPCLQAAYATLSHTVRPKDGGYGASSFSELTASES
jgi:hypothetical protein